MYKPLFEQHPKCITCKELREHDHDAYDINQDCAHFYFEIHDPQQMYCSEWVEIKGGKHETPKP